MNWVPTGKNLHQSASKLFWGSSFLGLCTSFPSRRGLQVSCQELVVFLSPFCLSSGMQFLCHCNNSPFFCFQGVPQAFMTRQFHQCWKSGETDISPLGHYPKSQTFWMYTPLFSFPKGKLEFGCLSLITLNCVGLEAETQ